MLYRWKSLGDSTEDRAVADCDMGKNTIHNLDKCGSSRKPSKRSNTMHCFMSIHPVLDRANSTVLEVATFKLPFTWANLERKADDSRLLAGGSQDDGF